MATLIRPTAPLLRELHQAMRVVRRPAFARTLKRLGLTNLKRVLWGFDTVKAGRTFYQPDEGGEWALIVPVYEHGEVIDLVACTPDYPDEMRTRCGTARLLGHEWTEIVPPSAGALDVFDNPLSWLAHDGEGVVVLDWKAAPQLLRDVKALRCESQQLADRLIEAFEWPLPYPPVLVPNGEKR